MTDPITSTGSVGTIQYSGLTSDTRWADVVDDLVKIERIGINRLENWRDEWVTKSTIIKQLESSLLVLESQAGDLNSSEEFLSTTSSSSNENVMLVTSNSYAETGAHTVTVGSEIPHILASQGFSSKDTAIGVIGEQDLVISVGSNTITLNYVAGGTGNDEFDSNSTLQDIADAINNDTDDNLNNQYLTASITGDGSSDNRYRLVLTATNGGPDNTISMSSNPLNLNFNSNNIGNTVESTWSGATATANGTSVAVDDKTYTFTASVSGSIGQSGSLLINWSDGTNTGTIDAGNGYTAGTMLSVADGLEISFANGNITNGEEFLVNVYNNIEGVEITDWRDTFPTPEVTGFYTGNTNKTFNFSLMEKGTLGSDEIDLYWTDNEGNSGTVTIPSTYVSGDEIDIFQGISVSFDTSTGSTLEQYAKFAVTVYHPTVQAAQNTGLAQAEVETHTGFIDADTTFVTTAPAEFEYTYNGVTRTVSIDSYSTLAEVAMEINADNDNPGVLASVINDGSGSTTAYHLQLVGRDTGAAYKIENIRHTLSNLTGTSSDNYGFSESQSAQNAMVKIDGYPTETNKYMQRSTNTIGDIITGVTLSLISTGTTTISTTIDKETIIENVQQFVDSVNDVLDYITAMTCQIDAGAEDYKGPMIGNYSFQIVEQRLYNILVSSVPGLDSDTDVYTLLSQVGISTEEDQITIKDSDEKEWIKTKRRFVLDTAEFDNALSENVDAVTNLFVKNLDTNVDGFAELIKAEAGNLTNYYTDENPGILQVLNQNYQNIVENIDTKIEREEIRIGLVEARLNRQFTALETMLGTLSGQENMLSAIIDASSGDS